MIICIDPGTRDSGTVMLSADGTVEAAGQKSNEEIIDLLRSEGDHTGNVLVIEHVQSMGMAVGQEVFDTVEWGGRFMEAWMDRGGTVAKVPRRDVKQHLCGHAKAKDPNIRAALIDLYGGSDQCKKGGRLERVKGHAWSALAVGVVYLDAHAGTFVGYNGGRERN